MELNIKNEDKALVLPEKCLSMLDMADAADLKVLIYIAGLRGGDFDAERAADFLQLDVSEVKTSVKFWSGASIIARDGAKKEPKKTVREKRIMHLTTDEVSALGEKNGEFGAFLNIAQQTAGWIFNSAEIEILASLYANLNLSPEYILSLIGYFVCKREKNLRYLEKVAYDYVDLGITTSDELEEKLREQEIFDGREGTVRSLFGLGRRKLTDKERSCLDCWFNKYGSSDELIELAYEKTVNATGKASVHYANSILARWHEKGYKTPEDVNNAGGRNDAGMKAQSFDIDEAFNRALERSYGSGENK
ncbi:MAG: DnaD domain protein [Clostridia bacterium]|nr:DnaD domain protein [Clostridia bacterium]